ncbi:ferric-chelate reductase Frp1 [Lecanora helva]
MAGMGMDMDMGSSGIFRPHNQSLARTYWYLVAACTLLACSFKASEALIFRIRKRSHRTLSLTHPTRPRNIISQSYATTIAILRELSYPSVAHFQNSWIEWLSPPPLGRSLAILTYWLIITLFLTTGSVIHDAYYWERIGFRAAWVSVTQVPLIYLFAGKVNVLGLVFGSSYIDLNWVHRWASRTLLITVTIHGGFFITEWVRADFFQGELEMMPMVKWGLAAWAVLVWTAFSSLLPLRRLCYELFVAQHLASAAVLLWLLYKHVPHYAAYNIWMAVAFAVSGRVLRACMFLFRNLPTKLMGHVAELHATPGDITSVVIRNIHFTWKPGQHVLLWCPSLGPLESHPFTIANVSQGVSGQQPNEIQLVIRARSGFTRRLHRRVSKAAGSRPPIIRAFLTGPLGSLPSWNAYETVILISASTGASFTLPILESILHEPCCVTHLSCVFLVRDSAHLDAYLPRLKNAAAHQNATQVGLTILIAVTGNGEELKPTEAVTKDVGSSASSTSSSSSSSEQPPQESHPLIIPSTATTTTTTPPPHPPLSEKHDVENTAISLTSSSTSSTSPSNPQNLHYTHHRPNLATIIRDPVEASAGETSVVVCGGLSLTSSIRGIVAGLADERAVHKGTGAQGIRLHVEGFGA